MRLTAAQIDDLKTRNPVPAVAGQWVTLREKSKDKFVGPCPLCSIADSRSAGRFACDADTWVCAVCADGGDVLKLVAKRAGLDIVRDFQRVVELLGGAGAAIEDTPATARRRGESDFRAGVAFSTASPFDRADLRNAWRGGWNAGKRKADIAADYRERERKRLYDNFWERAGKASRSRAAAYLAQRGLLMPDNAKLRVLDNVPYFLDGKEHAEPIGHYAAMLAPILHETCGGGHRFGGLHFTYLDPATPKGKAVIRHPVTGELLPAKKARGSKQGGYIDLGGCAGDQAARVVAGEGIENTLFGFTALTRAGRDVSRTHFRCGIDLGNLAGKALDRLPHPTAKTDAGRAQRVSGIAPDPASPAMPLPAGVRAVVWMCDGDSDPFSTRCAMKRVEARHASPHLKQIFMWPGDGYDWNDRIKP